jgi:hypothetical protein
MDQSAASPMIRRRAAAAGIHAQIGNHSFRAAGITAYLGSGGALEHAQFMAAHESPRTTKLYDRTKDRLTQDEVERTRAVTDKDTVMRNDEIAFRAAINVLWDTLESRRMPSGLPLAPDAAELHDHAARSSIRTMSLCSSKPSL